MDAAVSLPSSFLSSLNNSCEKTIEETVYVYEAERKGNERPHAEKLFPHPVSLATLQFLIQQDFKNPSLSLSFSLIARFFTSSDSVKRIWIFAEGERVNMKFAKAYASEISSRDLWKRSCTAQHYIALYRGSLHNYFISKIYRAPSALFAWHIPRSYLSRIFTGRFFADAAVTARRRTINPLPRRLRGISAEESAHRALDIKVIIKIFRNHNRGESVRGK